MPGVLDMVVPGCNFCSNVFVPASCPRLYRPAYLFVLLSCCLAVPTARVSCLSFVLSSPPCRLALRVFCLAV